MAYNGVYAVFAEEVAEFEQWLGSEVDSVALHGGKASWDDWYGSINRMVLLSDDIDRTATFSIPMFAASGSLERAAEGHYNDDYALAAKTLAEGFAHQDVIYVRTGEEFNGVWFPWSAKGREDTYIQAYRNFVDAFRSVSDKFKFEWNANIGQVMDPATAYPGDDYVDVIGMDFYWNKKWDPDTPVEAWDYMVNRKWGLQWHQDFAKAHGKPTAYSEWGVSDDNAGPYLERVAEWFDSHDVAYANFWNSNSVFRGKLSENQFPNTGEVFKELFGDAAPATPQEPAPLDPTDSAQDPDEAPAEAPGGGMIGDSADNVIAGGGADDVLDGKGGEDTLSGGAGNDAYYLGFDADKVVERAGEGVDVVYSSATHVLAPNVENIVLSGGGRAAGIGNELNNKIVGGATNNYLRGNEGADTLEGGGGADTLEGSEGGDILRGGAGNDVFIYSRTVYSRTEPDRIVDLTAGDKVDFSLLDADTSASGDQAFTKVAALTGQAGQAVVSYDSEGGFTSVVLDVNGDKAADAVVHISGAHTDFTGWVW